MSKKAEAMPVQEQEQAAMLAKLTAEANSEPPAPGTPEAIAAEAEANAPPPPDLAAELSGLILTVASVLKPALPSLEKIYTEDQCTAAGSALAAVCNKRGWLQSGVFGGYGEEITALAVVGPMAVATYAGIRADMAALRKTPIDAAKRGEPTAANEAADNTVPINMLERG